MITKKIEFTSPDIITVHEQTISRGGIIGKSFYGELNHKGGDEPMDIMEASHIVRKFVSVSEPSSFDKKNYVEINFLENVSTSEKSKKAYEFIESGIINGTIKPVPVLVNNDVLVRLDLVYVADPVYPDAFKKHIRTDFEPIFKGTNDVKALKLCQKYSSEIEIMNDNDGSWVQHIGGTEDDDIIYDFKQDFGNRDGVFNLFKNLGITAKSV